MRRGMRKGMPRWLTWSFAAGVFVARVAAADEVPTVTISASGPDREIPAGKSFYVGGESGRNTKAVQVAIVRVGSPWMWGGDPPSCSTVATEIAIDHPRDPHPEFLDPGVHRVFEQFPGATRRRDDQVLLSATWVRPDTAGETFKALVTADDEFYAPGYAYCLFVFKQTQKVDDASIQKLIASVAAALDACGKNLAAGATVTTAETSCRNATQSQFDADLAALLDEAQIVSGGKPGAPPTCPIDPVTGKTPQRDLAYCALRGKIDEALKYAVNLFVERDRLDPALNLAAPAHDLDRGWLPAQRDHLAAAVIAVLRNHGSLYPSFVESMENGARVRTVLHVTGDGKIAVTHISLLDDDLHIRVSSAPNPTAAQTKTLDGVTTKDLIVADGITLFDLLQIRRGIVTTDKEPITLSALRALVRSTDAIMPWAPRDLATAQAASKRISAIADFAAASDPVYTEWTPTAIREHTRAWLSAASVLPAGLGDIAIDLAQLVVQKPGYDAAAHDLPFVAAEQVQLGGPKAVRFQVGFDQKNWVFSYLTPTIGYAQIRTEDGWISRPYAAVQLHFYPNPVDRPLWRHGIAEDWRRAFALEAGLATSTSSFGRDDRYRGIFGLPAVYLGAVVHVVPYTSLTVGAAFLERRSTVLTAENPSRTASLFIGFSAQVNLPDLIRQQHTTTAVTSSAGN